MRVMIDQCDHVWLSVSMNPWHIWALAALGESECFHVGCRFILTWPLRHTMKALSCSSVQHIGSEAWRRRWRLQATKHSSFHHSALLLFSSWAGCMKHCKIHTCSYTFCCLCVIHSENWKQKEWEEQESGESIRRREWWFVRHWARRWVDSFSDSNEHGLCEDICVSNMIDIGTVK